MRVRAVPLYEYKCDKCGHRFEKIESVSASSTKKCPKCGGKAERQFSAPAIQFKGSGWYVTDYAGKGSASAEGSSGDGTAKGAEKGSEKTAESKAAPTEKGDKSEKSSSKKKK
jgi:putative FmdB family regulatory protein